MKPPLPSSLARATTAGAMVALTVSAPNAAGESPVGNAVGITVP